MKAKAINPLNEINLKLWSYINTGDINSLTKVIEENLKSQETVIKQAICLLRINPGKSGGDTILNFAFEKKAEQLISVLMSSKILPKRFLNHKNQKGYSPIWLAVEQKNYNFVEAAFQDGANPNCSCNKGNTLLHVATEKFDHKLIKLLLTHKDIKVPDNLIPYLIHLDVPEEKEKERTNTLKLLINYGCDLISPIIKNTNQSHYRYVKLLEANGIDLKLIDKQLTVPLVISGVDDNYEKELIDLLTKEVKGRTQLKNSASLLFWASKNDSQSIVYGNPKEIISHISKLGGC